MFSRRLVEAGDLPLTWLQEMASDQARTKERRISMTS